MPKKKINKTLKESLEHRVWEDVHDEYKARMKNIIWSYTQDLSNIIHTLPGEGGEYSLS